MTHRIVGSLLALSFAGGAFACSQDATAPKDSRSLATALEGRWADTLDFLGTSFVMDLLAHDTAITGTGNYSIEAGRSGTITVSGQVSFPQVDLDITYDYGPVRHFRGTLDSHKLLTGITWSEPVGDPVGETFRQVK